MNRNELITQIRRKGSFLCVGLDTDPQKLPALFAKDEDAVFNFNKAIIDATHDLCVAYKPNTAFYESLGVSGWIALEKTIDYLNTKYPDHFTIADAKRGDIGNTSAMYAKAFLDKMNFDSVTVAPYMGEDSVTPFLGKEGKWVILLALTSNKGALDLQTLNVGPADQVEEKLFERVLKVSGQWGNASNMMYVVGATQASMLERIRQIVPDHFLLVPGVGAQGGSLEDVARFGMNKDCGLLVNASRSILYASSGSDFAEKAREEALNMQQQMAALL
ncbi:MAG TPA: orotidine-5'-phosphate decarboxylase [Flavobacteriales bacterium]|nr:orotidine-5'-phosphate decarboxylase [Flavobacteriales bacterium]HRE75164.1 orotidine-5'-phosphate decarboxylase [Flavobacteriales bacterium]HRJ35238.1 orotidine-5'-phosphate decarboxylase [Flavobacteriales bacterium]HRJ39676.1 orotidine-5'-phosphate decarboxylase [Flavobacteriales bacterium]